MHQFTEIEGWKNLLRYFVTRSQKSHYVSNTAVSWNNCGNQNIFGDCPAILDFWREIHNAFQDIFKCVLRLESKTYTYIYLPQDWRKIHTWRIYCWWLLKRLMRKWFVTGKSNYKYMDGNYNLHLQNGQVTAFVNR